MPKAKLLFTQHYNSYKVQIPNLETLSVEQIQELEEFARIRKGLFDFSTYSFVIQKRMEFFEFVSLLKHLGINADVEEVLNFKDDEPRVGFGQYKGMLYNELPDSYLLWLKINYRGSQRNIIEQELQKRGL